jgi:hypothetical protein
LVYFSVVYWNWVGIGRLYKDILYIPRYTYILRIGYIGYISW